MTTENQEIQKDLATSRAKGVLAFVIAAAATAFVLYLIASGFASA